MEIELIKLESNFQFLANNGEFDLPVCATPALEEGNHGFRPMQLLLVGLAGCMSIDVLNILKKQKQSIRSYKVTAKAKRSEAQPPIFEEIELHFTVAGSLEPNKLQRAISLAEEKYCSVHHILNKTAKITCKIALQNDGL